MEEIIAIILIYAILMIIINILSNKDLKRKHDIETINIESTNDELVEQIDEVVDLHEKDLLESPNNNRHSYMYQDVEKEILKVDHAFSKEVFLNNARELFFKYYNALAQGEFEDAKEYLTEEFYNILKNRINENRKNNIKVIVDKIYIYNAFLYEFSKSTDNQVITVKIMAEMKNYEINTVTEIVTEGNKYAKIKLDYEMQFVRKTKSLICKSCGAAVDTRDLSVCRYCNTPIEVENNDWKLNYINIFKN